MVKYIFASIIGLFLWSCKCQRIECENGPPTIEFSVIDSTGAILIHPDNLLNRSFIFRNINSTTVQFYASNDTIVSVGLDKGTEKYILKLGGSIIDTFQITVLENKGECCDFFDVIEVKRGANPISFRPFVLVRL